ncbi:hypothetical protein GCM10010912_00100 [Paenibacillus albidus]|uniref:Uncharacterized protein n=1 Tax=Paenibacillus albidus TaxID=2041023 RepID=A0A917BVF6_9BACL|nr:hypothetical protein GCM10010912_00100 [Paenibacillus albidus]
MISILLFIKGSWRKLIIKKSMGKNLELKISGMNNAPNKTPSRTINISLYFLKQVTKIEHKNKNKGTKYNIPPCEIN